MTQPLDSYDDPEDLDETPSSAEVDELLDYDTDDAARAPAKYVDLQSTERPRFGLISFLSIRRFWKLYAVTSGLSVIILSQTHFWLKHPRVRTHPALDWNTRVAAIPESDRAWPLYRQAALVRLARPGDRDSLRSLFKILPGEPRWMDAHGWLERNADLVAIYRQAASRPTLGAPVTDALDPEWSAALGQPHRPPSPDPALIGVGHEILTELRDATYALCIDSRRAVDEGDPARAASNIQHLLAIADHAREAPTIIGDMVSSAVLVSTSVEAREACAYLDESSLAWLAEAFSRRDRVIARPDFQRLVLDDTTQRWFSDGGWRGGMLTAQGLRGMRRNIITGGEPPPLSLAAKVIAPISVAGLAGRTEHVRAMDHVMGEFERDIALRPWERGEPRAEAARDAYATSKHDLVRILTMNIPYSVRGEDRARAEIDATILTFAIARHHRRVGHDPEGLEALVPSELPAIPVDPFDGRPVRIRRNPDGLVFYYVGADGDDDAGRPNPDPDADVQTWLPPARRSTAPDGDWIVWPVRAPGSRQG